MLNLILQELKDFGAKPYYVGGYVRDYLLKRKTVDIDIEVFNIDKADLLTILNKYGKVITYDKFGVFKLKELEHLELAIPRTEQKVGNSHTDFIITNDKALSIADAAYRRDFTINSMYMDPFTNEIIDPYHGKADLANQLIKHLGDKFKEDPLRILRALRFSATLNFKIADETIQACLEIIEELNYISNERILNELLLYIDAKYFDIYYFKILLSNYYEITTIDKQINNLKTSQYIATKIFLFFYYLNQNDLTKLTLVFRNKSYQKLIRLTTYNLLDNYELFLVYRQLDHKIFTDLITVLNIKPDTKQYDKLLKQYPATYFINQGYPKHLIKIMQEKTFKELLTNKND